LAADAIKEERHGTGGGRRAYVGDKGRGRGRVTLVKRSSHCERSTTRKR